MIKKLNLKTPGREEDNEETKLYTRADYEMKKGAAKSGEAKNDDELSETITQGLGGKENISDVDACATRLRITVLDGDKVRENVLKSTGAAGVVQKGQGVQVIYGPKVTIIKSNLEDYLAGVGSSKKVQEPVEEEPTPIAESVNTGVKEYMINAPITGNVVDLSQVGDGVFSEGMLGKGFAIEPTEGKVIAPFDCKVETVFATKHAIGLSSGKLELLIHIGMDTVQLDGKGFEIKVQDGDMLKQGDVIGFFDIKTITDAGYRTITSVVVTNTDAFETFDALKKGSTKAGEKVLRVK